MLATVVKGDIIHDVTSEEQLNSFLEDGYVVKTEDKEEPKPKKKPSKSE